MSYNVKYSHSDMFKTPMAPEMIPGNPNDLSGTDGCTYSGIAGYPKRSCSMNPVHLAAFRQRRGNYAPPPLLDLLDARVCVHARSRSRSGSRYLRLLQRL